MPKMVSYPAVVDVRPYDRFERFRSTRTGAFLVFRYRRVAGQAYEESDLVATFGSQGESTKCRNALRTAAERMRTSCEYDARLKVWTALDTQEVSHATT
jgi:hypothetical protein